MAERFWIKTLAFSDGTIVPLSNLTVLVGPNNSGKSRALKDVVDIACTQGAPELVVVQKAECDRPKTIGALSGLYGLNASVVEGRSEMHFLRPELVGRGSASFGAHKWPEHFGDGCPAWHYANFAAQLIAFLKTETRLSMVETSDSSDDARLGPSNLLQALYLCGSKKERELRKTVTEAFPGVEIALDYSMPRTLQFRVARDFTALPPDPRDAAQILSRCRRLDEQGDGLRSYVGIVTAFTVVPRPVFLIDEPEAFLHPPQAFRLGQFIASQANDSRQVIISTHSADIVRGIIFHNPDAQIVRVDRVDDRNIVRVLDRSELKTVTFDPLLSAAGVLDGLFSSTVIVTEADADSRFYLALSKKSAPSLDVHFVNADNKQTVPKVLAPYRKLGVRCAGIVDIDVLNNADEFTKQIDAAGIDGATRARALEIRAAIAKEVDATPVDERIVKAKTGLADMTKFLCENEGAEPAIKEKVLLQVRGRLERLKAETSAWEKLKREGIGALTHNGRVAFDELFKICANASLFINPCGELEASLSECGVKWESDKRAWIKQALELVPNLTPDDKKEPWKFIASVHTHLAKPK